MHIASNMKLPVHRPNPVNQKRGILFLCVLLRSVPLLHAHLFLLACTLGRTLQKSSSANLALVLRKKLRSHRCSSDSYTFSYSERSSPMCNLCTSPLDKVRVYRISCRICPGIFLPKVPPDYLRQKNKARIRQIIDGYINCMNCN